MIVVASIIHLSLLWYFCFWGSNLSSAWIHGPQRQSVNWHHELGGQLLPLWPSPSAVSRHHSSSSNLTTSFLHQKANDGSQKTELQVLENQKANILLTRALAEEQMIRESGHPIIPIEATCFTETIPLLRRDGVARLDNVLSAETCHRLRDYVLKLKDDSEKEVAQQKRKTGIVRQDRFAKCLLGHQRWDLLLPLVDIVQSALEQILLATDDSFESTTSSSSPLLMKDVLESVLGGPNCTLHELACLISEPESDRQNIHPDHAYQSDKTLPVDEAMCLTCFVALQDVTIDMGPTIWLPGTHTGKAHDAFQRRRVEDPLDCNGLSPKDQLLINTPSVVGLLPAGSCVLFDSRVLHCGTANTVSAGSCYSDEDDNSHSAHARALFYFSFKNSKAQSLGKEQGSLGYGLNRRDSRLALMDVLDIVARGSDVLSDSHSNVAGT